MNSIKEKLRLLPLSKTIIPVVVTDEMLDKIKYLCKVIPSQEWSGILFYSVEGSIKDIDNFKIILEDVYPMDKGNSVYTSYEYDETIVEYRMDNPKTLSMNMGHIHSHNVMPTFFSVTDSEELTDNAGHYNYYVSVIVNNYLDFTIRVAMIAEGNTISYTLKDEEGRDYVVSSAYPDKVVMYYNAEVEKKPSAITVHTSFADRVKAVIDNAFKREEMKKAKDQTTFQSKFVKDQLALQSKFSKNGNGFGKTKTFPLKNLPKPKNGMYASHDDYMIVVEAFIIDLLKKNAKINTVIKELNPALGVVVSQIKQARIPEFVAATISDYTEVYDEFFVSGPNIEVDFEDDLDAVIDLLNDSKYAKSALVTVLVDSLEEFKEQYLLALDQSYDNIKV